MIISQVGLFQTKITCSSVRAQPRLLFPNCLPTRWRADVIVKCKSWTKTRTLNTAEWNSKPAISSACGHGSGSRSRPLSSCHSQNSWLGKASAQIFVTHWFHTDELLRWEIAQSTFSHVKFVEDNTVSGENLPSLPQWRQVDCGGSFSKIDEYYWLKNRADNWLELKEPQRENDERVLDLILSTCQQNCKTSIFFFNRNRFSISTCIITSHPSVFTSQGLSWCLIARQTCTCSGTIASA